LKNFHANWAIEIGILNVATICLRLLQLQNTSFFFMLEDNRERKAARSQIWLGDTITGRRYFSYTYYQVIFAIFILQQSDL